MCKDGSIIVIRSEKGLLILEWHGANSGLDDAYSTSFESHEDDKKRNGLLSRYGYTAGCREPSWVHNYVRNLNVWS